MTGEPAAPVQPMAKWKQTIVLAVMIGGAIAVFRWVRGSGECTTKTFGELAIGHHCRLRGTLETFPAPGNLVTHYALGDRATERFALVDADGRVEILFAVGTLQLPASGTTVDVDVEVTSVPSLQTKRLVASSVEVAK